MKNTYKNRLANLAIISAIAMAISSTPAMAWQCTSGSVSGSDVQERSSGSAPGASSSKYTNQIRKAKLQIGDNSGTCFSSGNQIRDSQAFNDHFWLSTNGNVVTFDEDGDSFRSELREEREFTVANSGNDYVRTRARVISRSGGIEEVTIAQLHSEDSIGPVARLNWADAGVNTDVDDNSPEGIWLSLRQSPTCTGGDDCFSHSFIGNIEGSYRTYRLGMWGDQLRLSIDGVYQNILREDIFNESNNSNRISNDSIDLDGTAWEGQPLFLKLGAYVNSDGGARVGHKDIAFF